jgi:Cysteine-rich CWC
MSEKSLENIPVKACESCGTDFTCGAKSETCWCFEIDLNAVTLAKLQEDFKSCLCRNCLKLISSAMANLHFNENL